jgi:hypothetical protein
MTTYRIYYQREGIPSYLPCRKRDVEAESMSEAKEVLRLEEEAKGHAVAWMNAERVQSKAEIEAEASRSSRWDRPGSLGGGTY